MGVRGKDLAMVSPVQAAREFRTDVTAIDSAVRGNRLDNAMVVLQDVEERPENSKGKPEWDILGIPHVETLPAVQWRLQNLAKADAKKREKLIGDLHKALGIEE